MLKAEERTYIPVSYTHLTGMPHSASVRRMVNEVESYEQLEELVSFHSKTISHPKKRQWGMIFAHSFRPFPEVLSEFRSCRFHLHIPSEFLQTDEFLLIHYPSSAQRFR